MTNTVVYRHLFYEKYFSKALLKKLLLMSTLSLKSQANHFSFTYKNAPSKRGVLLTIETEIIQIRLLRKYVQAYL